MRVFIGSSSQGSDDLAIVEKLIKAQNMVPVPWTNEGTFELNSGTWESLLKLTREVDAGVFIFREDDELRRDNMLVSTTRDNVILEFGLFCGALGARRCAIFRRGQPSIPSDLKGVTVVSLDDMDAAQEKVRLWGFKMRAGIKVPFVLNLQQIRAIAKAMLKTNISMDQVYSLMIKLGASKQATNDALR